MSFRPYYLGFFLFLCDFLSKSAMHLFLPYGNIDLIRNLYGIRFSLTYVANRGAAWGALGEYQLPLLLFRIALIGAMTLYLFSMQHPLIRQIPLVLLVVGAFGNVLDYFIYGHVVDMFHFVFWGIDFPVFNVADAMISLSICWLLLLSLFPEGTSVCREKMQ